MLTLGMWLIYIMKLNTANKVAAFILTIFFTVGLIPTLVFIADILPTKRKKYACCIFYLIVIISSVIFYKCLPYIIGYFSTKVNLLVSKVENIS